VLQQENVQDLEVQLSTSEKNVNDIKEKLREINLKRTNIDNEVEVLSKKLEQIKDDCDK